MGRREKRDTCDWCGRGTNKLQMKGRQLVGLCPTCCPDLDADNLPPTDHLPPQWHYWGADERKRWLDGDDAETIVMEAYYEEAQGN